MPGRIRPMAVAALMLCAILFAGIHYPLYAQSDAPAKAVAEQVQKQVQKLDARADVKLNQKMEGWANVPGGTVWLNPGTQAYEHDTGLVRDLQTGQKSMPITPQSLQANRTPNVYWQTPQLVQPQVPCCPQQPAPFNPFAYNPVYPVPRTYNPYQRPWYDLGPNDVYAPSIARPGSGYGAKLGSHGEINQRWKATQLPK